MTDISPPTTAEILNKYGEVYPRVEALVSDQARLYARGLEDLERLYGEWNITGAEKAKLMAQYVVNATTALISGSQQMALSLLERAYTLPVDIARKDAETATYRKQLELMQAQIGNTDADSLLKSAQKDSAAADALEKTAQAELAKGKLDEVAADIALKGRQADLIIIQQDELEAKIDNLRAQTQLTDIQQRAGEAEVSLQTARVRTELKEAALREAQIQKQLKEAEYVNAQCRVLEEASILNSLIKLFQSLSDMIGNMGSGGLQAPVIMQAANRESILASLRELNRSAALAGREAVIDPEILDYLASSM